MNELNFIMVFVFHFDVIRKENIRLFPFFYGYIRKKFSMFLILLTGLSVSFIIPYSHELFDFHLKFKVDSIPLIASFIDIISFAKLPVIIFNAENYTFPSNYFLY